MSETPSPWARGIQCAIGTCTILGNSLVLVAVLRGRKQLREPIHKLIACLAVADLMLGVCVWVRESLMQARSHLGIQGQAYGCAFFVALVFLSAGVSLTLLLLLGIERFFNSTSSTGDLHYRINNSTVRKLITFTWLIQMVIGFIAFAAVNPESRGAVDIYVCRLGAPFLQSWYWTSVFILTLVQSFGVFVLYLGATRTSYNALQLMRKVIANRHQGFVFSTSGWQQNGGNISCHKEDGFDSITCTSPTHGNPDQLSPTTDNKYHIKKGVHEYYEMRLAKRNLNLMKTLVIIAVVFLICWNPYFAMLLVEQIYLICCQRQLDSNMARWMAILPLIGSLSNFLIYPLKLKEYRQEMKNVILCIFRRPSSQIEIGDNADADERVATIAITTMHPIIEHVNWK